jgi:hypothetical protein
MHIIYQPRQTGKTTKLIKRAAKIKGIIVCFNRLNKKNILTIAKELNLKINDPITFSEFIKREHNSSDKYLIDNADHFIRFITKKQIDTIVVDIPDTILYEEFGCFM